MRFTSVDISQSSILYPNSDGSQTFPLFGDKVTDFFLFRFRLYG